jgi:hypothetical protein
MIRNELIQILRKMSPVTRFNDSTSADVILSELRCDKCKHYDKRECTNDGCMVWPLPDDFCSRFVRAGAR